MTNPTDPMELLRRFWAPLGVPVPGASFVPPMAFPTADPDEIGKRIADLRSVEGWLTLNLEMVRTTIQGLEAQQSTLTAFRAMQDSMSATFKAQAEQMARAAGAASQPVPSDPPRPAGESRPPRPRRKKKPAGE